VVELFEADMNSLAESQQPLTRTRLAGMGWSSLARLVIEPPRETPDSIWPMLICYSFIHPFHSY
jgi:hypothetical protein